MNKEIIYDAKNTKKYILNQWSIWISNQAMIVDAHA